MSDFKQILTAALRLKLLQLLVEAPGYSANNQILHMACEGMGLRVTGDQVRSELSWLEEQRCLTLVALAANIIVAEIKERGLDVARGRTQLPGIERPVPGA